MGLRIFGRSSCKDDSCKPVVVNAAVPTTTISTHKKKGVAIEIVGNPNPKNFEIIRHRSIGRFVVVLVKYPDCLNYEGLKVLVFENVSLDTIKNLKIMDPHFCDSIKHPSPVARFVPTTPGFNYAIRFCEANSA